MSNAARDNPASPPKGENRRHAKFSSEHVATLAELSIDGGHLFGTSRFIGIQVEPVPDGGVTLSATNGSVLIWVNDPDGYASDVIVIDPDEPFIDVLRPPELPAMFDSDGERIEVPPPAWTLPGDIMVVSELTGAASSKWVIAPAASGFDMILLFPEGQPPGMSDGDGLTLYKATGRMHGRTQTINRPKLDWGKVVPTGPQVAIEQINIAARNLRFLSQLGRTMRFRFYGPDKAMIVDYDGDPNVHAAIMPCDPNKFAEHADDDSSEESSHV